ncbi:AhpC/TSA family protein [Sphingobacterium shayense]|uniref:peroxiredoxin-like family protein n=1 Tax=Sphingobacterium shayense TaxID=626343 RepID=UPI001553C87E|nr:peroxiredoxin-like family protein [Sphingobacterium shayense]NQD72443.1 AhpC/TSA family protein [Sphingobacterium shayense]
MKSIKQKINRIMSLLGMLIILNQVNAQSQQKDGNMRQMEMDKIAMGQHVYPQKAEDISPLLVGENIPMVMLMSQQGEVVDLNKMVAKKPTILIFYRGGWCPYCSKQLSGLQEILGDLKGLGYQLIAISTDTPEGLNTSIKNEKLEYTLLSDSDLSVSKKFGLAFKAPKAYWDLLPQSTGGKDIDLLLPVPSVFILSRTGEIMFEYINPDITKRLKPELLKVVAETIIKDL